MILLNKTKDACYLGKEILKRLQAYNKAETEQQEKAIEIELKLLEMFVDDLTREENKKELKKLIKGV